MTSTTGLTLVVLRSSFLKALLNADTCLCCTITANTCVAADGVLWQMGCGGKLSDTTICIFYIRAPGKSSAPEMFNIYEVFEPHKILIKRIDPSEVSTFSILVLRFED